MTAIFSLEKQGTPEWLTERMGLCTASNFSKVLATIKSGEAAERRNYRIRLALERITSRQQDCFVNDAMKLGTEREPLARMAYELLTGNNVMEVGFCRHPTLDCGASCDGIIDAKKGVEFKCPSPGKHVEYMHQKSEPPEYTAQIQGCIWMTDRTEWDFASFNPEFPDNAQLIVRTVRRDQAYIDRLQSAVEVFLREVANEVEAIRNHWCAA